VKKGSSLFTYHWGCILPQNQCRICKVRERLFWPVILSLDGLVSKPDYNIVVLSRLAWPILVGVACILGGLHAANSAQIPITANGCPPAQTLEHKETPAEITVADLRFEGDDLQMPAADQAKIAASIRERRYAGSLDKVASEVAERVRRAWQEDGYFKVQATPEATVLTSNPAAARIAVDLHVDEGPQYRLRDITFKNVRAIRNKQALRGLFPLKDGDIFNTDMVRVGLDNLRKAYSELGYINFTSVPDTMPDEDARTVSLVIDVDEGKLFYLSSVNVLGLDGRDYDNDLRIFQLEPGKVYNYRSVELFFRKYASSDTPHFQGSRVLDTRAGTVALTLDFRQCPVE